MGGLIVPWIEALGIVVVLWGVLEAFIGLALRGWSLAILGGIVVIRTVIVYFMNIELSRGAKQGGV